jgi:spore coat protein CotH
MYIVLVTTGKREDVEEAAVFIRETKEEADSIVKKYDDRGVKYWTKAQIVQDGYFLDGVELNGYENGRNR